MKYIKMLGLAMVAAIAAMAFVGASSASASTSLCKINQLPCESTNQYGSGTSISASLESGTKAVLKSSLGNVECTTSAVGGITTSGAGETVAGEIETLTFEGCTRNGASCTVAPVTASLPYPASIAYTEAMNGNMTVEGAEVHVTCGEFINCTFGGTVKPLRVIGGSMALVEAAEVNIPLIKGGICPLSAKWTANYLVTKPEPLWIST